MTYFARCFCLSLLMMVGVSGVRAQEIDLVAMIKDTLNHNARTIKERNVLYKRISEQKVFVIVLNIIKQSRHSNVEIDRKAAIKFFRQYRAWPIDLLILSKSLRATTAGIIPNDHIRDNLFDFCDDLIDLASSFDAALCAGL